MQSRKKLSRHPKLIVAPLLLTLAACQGPPGDRGAPLVELHATVATSDAKGVPSTLVAGLIWAIDSSSGSAMVSSCGQVPNVAHPDAVEVPIEGSFPSLFTLDIYAPPAPAIFDGYATAQVVVFDKPTRQLWGAPDPATTLVYVTSSYDPGKLIGQPGIPRQDDWYLYPHAPGFYLLQRIKDSMESGGAPGTTPVKVDWDAPQGLKTPLGITLVPPTPPTATPCPTTMHS